MQDINIWIEEGIKVEDPISGDSRIIIHSLLGISHTEGAYICKFWLMFLKLYKNYLGIILILFVLRI